MPNRKPPNLELGRLLAERIPRGHRKRIATEIGISERHLGRILSGYEPPREALLLKLQNKLKIADEDMERVRGRDSHLREIFNWYRSNRDIILPVAREYYAGLSEVLSFPLVTKTEWIPAKPLLLSDLDKHLTFLPDEPEPPIKALRMLNGRTFSKFVWSIAEEVRLSKDFVYRMIDVKATGAAVQITFGPTRYHHFVDSCEAVQFELGEWCHRNERSGRQRKPRTNGADLPLRGPADNIFDLRNRIASTGICVAFVILNTSVGQVFYIHDRSLKKVAGDPKVMEGPSGFSLVPGGTFQPDSREDVNHERDFSLVRTVLRELAEELLGLEAVEETMRTGHDFYEDPRVRPFVAALDEGFARAFF
jgi:hypothetical protein